MSKTKNRLPEKAYKDLEFLTSSAARTVRILSEYYEPQARLEKSKIEDTIVFFGSARLMSLKDAKKNLREVKKLEGKRGYKEKLRQAEIHFEMSRYYEDAVELSKRLTEWSMGLENGKKRFIICSGGGPGIMEAANKGASLAGGESIGFNISIPFEQFANKYIAPDLSFEFHYFFMRKFWFTYLAKSLVVFPGGFGTMDELMEVLTLVQTEKLKKDMSIIVYDSKFWKSVLNFDALIEMGTISKGDLKLFDFCDNVDEAFEKITQHLTKNYINK